MGNNSSFPEKVFSAVRRNDVCQFQALVAHLTAPGASNEPAARAAVLEYKDRKGRTPLLLAAAKNYHDILQQLIQLGADVHYINTVSESAGGALHEAARRRHEATVELLLAAGASPFVANVEGRTALDEAVLSGHTGVVRAIEKYAEFSGVVSFKSRSIGGLSSRYKPRWVVLIPYYPLSHGRDLRHQTQGGGSSTSSTARSLDARKPRRCLWLYKDKTRVSPRCRLWVDGATVLTSGPAGTEGTLRLHTSHGEPKGDLITAFSRGYCVFMRPADLTSAANLVYSRLVTLLNGGDVPGVQQQPASPSSLALYPAVAAAMAAGNSRVSQPSPSLQSTSAALMPPLLPEVTVPYYPVLPPAVAHSSAAGGASAFILMPQPPQVPVMPSSSYSAQSVVFPVASGPCPMASPLCFHQHRQEEQQEVQGLLPNSPSAPFSVPTSPHQPQRARMECNGGCSTAAVGALAPAALQPLSTGLGGEIVGARLIEDMVALPGESDEAFAQRLASAISAASGQSQQTLYSWQRCLAQASSSSVPVAPTTTTSIQQQPHVQEQRHSETAARSLPSLINFHSDPGNSPGPTRTIATSVLLQSGQPGQGRPIAAAGGPLNDLHVDAMNTLIAIEMQPPQPRRALQEMEPSAPPGDECTASSLANMSPHKQPPTSVSPEPEPEPECIICLNAPKEVGFLHGDSVHRCVCRECSMHIAVGAPCPLCRQPVERVLGVY